MWKDKIEIKFALGYLGCAVLLLVLFSAGHLTGLRAHTSILANPFGGDGASFFAGAYYVITWLGLVMAAPILTGAALFSFLIGLLRGR